MAEVQLSKQLQECRMSLEADKCGASSQPNRVGLSIVPKNSEGADRSGLSQKVVPCPKCLRQTEYKDGHEYCGMCGAGLSSVISTSHYSGHEPNLVPIGHEVFQLKPTVRAVNERRHPRIPCRNVKACIKTEQSSSVIVDVINISRGGVCFMSFIEFHPGTQVSIAMHYIEGGHIIFQGGRIIRAKHSGSATLPGEYAIEFLR
jgi:hypothetical protein